ncbi:hypothetical protein PI23P_07635 [Polaribacter irgensii 23-P]|uniref:DUF2851 domain-containing protein n=1 Tax=Polaribacter irgensii 23-P TaxID=313594 RepID=A4BZ86_9FLAO|nr:DUF2851 family protein [Polaribacter irgensii]EAR12479.1 hypothetical protein PI23P_07635 [Polaribacter irgensii 23-P]
MNEDFLHYVWKYKVFSKVNFKTTSHEDLMIVRPGLHNKNTGPDFLSAHLKIENQTWIGNVEIHLKSSDWYVHNHEVDLNYDAVILHVVWEDDVAIYMENNKPLPTFVLKDVVDVRVVANYQRLFFKAQSWIPCQDSISTVDLFTFSNWKERLYFERLENKSKEIEGLLQKENNNFEAVLFQLLVKNFGLKVNGDAFLRLSQSVDFSVFKSVRNNENKIAALLFGQAGFLEGAVEEVYYHQLQKEYAYLKHKYGLQTIANNQFSFFRMRPTNFPTIRIAQLVSLFYKYQSLFSQLITLQTVQEFYDFFSLETHFFWKTHYSFTSISKSARKSITKSFVDLLIINTIVPMKFLYQKARGEHIDSSFLKILKEMSPEKNNIISKFAALKISANNALDTQSLLELKKNYCTPKRCLECAIGRVILNKY